MTHAPQHVDIYDTTLRDGTQGEGFNLSLADKVNIAVRLDAFGVDFIEGGYPLSNEKDRQFFQEMRRLPLKHAKVAAFGMTRRRGLKAEDDPGMQSLLEAQTPVVTIVGKTSDYQVEKVLGVSLDENIAMIADTIKLLRAAGRDVVYDAEHFFDTYRTNRAYAMRTLAAARDAGASVLCLCDTNGGSMPEFVAEAVADVRKQTGATIGIHTHNDAALAMANGLAAVRAGATHAQGTMNGVGERCGNMDLVPFVANLRLKYGVGCLQPDSLEQLTAASRFVYETANLLPVSGQAYVGPSAFAHKGGMHVQAVRKDVSTYEHVPPEMVGNGRKVLISEMSGLSNVASKIGDQFDLAGNKDALRRVLDQVKTLENDGYQFEAADASFELLVRKAVGQHRTFWNLDHYRVVVLRTAGTSVSEATVKLHVGHAVEHRVAEGDGPVNALDGALRKALKDHFPSVMDVHLTDYKVRVINSKDETAAKVRVVIECRRTNPAGESALFGTIGVSENIIDASWQALVDAYEYHLLKA